MSKVRIYELARELKLESRKVLEDARRLGVEASVPSNTLEDAVADKIREMYYPKKEPVTTQRSARLVKAAKTAHETTPEPTESTTSAAPVTTTVPTPPAPVSHAPSTAAKSATLPTTPTPDHLRPRVVKLQKPAPIEAPAPIPVEEPVAPPPIEAALEASTPAAHTPETRMPEAVAQIGRASCRERVYSSV